MWKTTKYSPQIPFECSQHLSKELTTMPRQEQSVVLRSNHTLFNVCTTEKQISAVGHLFYAIRDDYISTIFDHRDRNAGTCGISHKLTSVVKAYWKVEIYATFVASYSCKIRFMYRWYLKNIIEIMKQKVKILPQAHYTGACHNSFNKNRSRKTKRQSFKVFFQIYYSLIFSLTIAVLCWNWTGTLDK